MPNKKYGTVIEINQNCGRIAVKLDNGDISVMDIYNPKSFEIGHIIYGQLDVLGGYFIFNKTTQAEYFAYVEASCCNLETAQQQLLLE